MSRELLLHLNQNRDGLFKDWLDQNPWEPRIAWYPNCRMDFRDLLYLHPSERNRNVRRVPASPTLFLHNDCEANLFNGGIHGFSILPASMILYQDLWTTIRIVNYEILPDLKMSQKGFKQQYNRSQTIQSKDHGAVIFMMLSIDSDRLGLLLQPVIYAIAESATFAEEVMLPQKARISHAWHTFPGTTNCNWIGHVLRRMQVEFLAKDGNFYEAILPDDQQNQETLDHFSSLRGNEADAPVEYQWTALGDFCDYWHPIRSWIKDRSGKAPRNSFERVPVPAVQDAFSEFAEIDTDGDDFFIRFKSG